MPTARAEGAWLGVALYLKPIAALVVAYRAWRRDWTAVATAVGAAGVGYAIGAGLSWSNTRGWIAVLGDVRWLHVSINLSLWGWIDRIGASLWLAIPAIGMVLFAVLWRLPRLTLDQAWAAVYLSALLVSPVGWIYYALPLVGPMLVVYDQGDRRTRGLLIAGYVGLCVPLSFQPAAMEAGGWKAATLGSSYLWAALSWWVAALSTAGFRPSASSRQSPPPSRDSPLLTF